MRKSLVCFFGIIAVFGLFSCGMHLFSEQNSENRMAEALQEALVLGSRTAALNLGDSSCASNLAEAQACATGYLGNKLVEILLPDTVSRVLNQINSFSNQLNSLPSPVQSVLKAAVGSSYNSLFDLGGYAKSLKTALNRGAEQAAPVSVGVFRDAILGMSFVDAREVLIGDSVAATSYLKTQTYDGLQNAFGPIIKIPLDALNPNKYWEPIASVYNSFATVYATALSMPSVTSAVSFYNAANSSNKINMPKLPYDGSLPTDLSESLTKYATGKALDGLFTMVGVQETELRADPWGTVKALGGFITDSVGELLGDIFGKAKDGVI